jgi:hypothetical protein
MNAFERTQEIANISPHPFCGVAVDFPDAIPIVVAGMLARAMRNGSMRTSQAEIAVVFIGVDPACGRVKR